MFPDDRAKLKAGRISNDERELILHHLGLIAKEYYAHTLLTRAGQLNYKLERFVGCFKVTPDVAKFENKYTLECSTEKDTKIANYFEYGTGLYNTKSPGKYRDGYIRPIRADHLAFMGNKGHLMLVDKVKGVKSVAAFTATVSHMKFHRATYQMGIRRTLT